MEPHFIKGGKYEKWNPLFETMATFAFTPKLVTNKGSHIRDGVDLKRTMMTVILALIPCLIFGIYNTCLLYTSPSPRDGLLSRMPSSA